MRTSLPQILTLALLTILAAGATAADDAVLWQIGAPDGNNTDLALAPGDHREFKDDGFFVVGSSTPSRDWPYVQPGPSDSWAGSRQHTFTILFSLKSPVPAGEAQLILQFLDTHSSGPPHLRVLVNGHSFDKQVPKGAGDASVNGEPTKGKPFTWVIPLPTGTLRADENEITITSLSGSWVLYDSVRMETPAGTELAPVKPTTKLVGVTIPPVWLKDGGRAVQPVHLLLRHVGDEAEASVQLGAEQSVPLHLQNGSRTVELKAPATEQPQSLALTLKTADGGVVSTNLTLRPPRIRNLWLLPHSHVDIGYTHRQDEVVNLQIENLEKAMELARASANEPTGMRFKWNPEAVWTLDHFLKRATTTQRDQFLQAVRNGDVGVDALYGNMLTGLCRPEELAQCLGFGARLSNLTGRPVLSASICDVPGYTWGMVPIMAQAGVKYFAIGPNFGDRVGTIHVWDDKPFYWKSQSGLHRVLCWVVDNYHHLGNLEENVLAQVDRLGRKGFPYDTSFIFWVGQWPNGGVDNAPPDEKTVEKVIAWNAKYAAPRVRIGLAGEFFQEFEQRHGSQLPEFAGDLTPYWEDGAGSTSKETAMNRESGDRLSQASALFAMRDPGAYPVEQFDQAWKNVLLYSEHTWGAWCSISKPDDAFTLDQWKVKQAFALDANRESHELLTASLPKPAGTASSVDVFNTTQWERTDLAVVPSTLAGSQVVSITDEKGRPVPSQRLATGELVFLAKDVPPFAAKRFLFSSKPAVAKGRASASPTGLQTGSLNLEVDPASGAIKNLRLKSLAQDFVDPSAPVGLNDYRYVLGRDAKGAKSNGPVKISVVDSGPLVASLRIESEAPGCNSLVRLVRVVDGLDRVDLINQVGRKSVREKDGVHFGFGFNVPGGTIRMETPWAVVRPNADQLPGSCRNWFTVQRWVDISAGDRGITWAPVDAPLMEIGGLTANLLGSVAFDEWMTNALDSRTIYSWAQNNHWHTNYKIDQPGLTTFRYILRPHKGGYSAMESARFGLETTRPLVVAAADGTQPKSQPLLTLSSPDVLLETVKISEDGKALILRLFGVTGQDRSVGLRWNAIKPARVWLSNLSEKALEPAAAKIPVRAYEVVTLRADLN